MIINIFIIIINYCIAVAAAVLVVDVVLPRGPRRSRGSAIPTRQASTRCETSVCVCVCARARERARERASERERESVCERE